MSVWGSKFSFIAIHFIKYKSNVMRAGGRHPKYYLNMWS